MKIFKTFTVFILFFLAPYVILAQNAKYVGEWKMTKSPMKEKCAKDQTISLKKDGTAIYAYGANTENCKKSVQEFESWNVTQKTFKNKEKTMKKTVLVIGEFEDIVLIINKRKGKKMYVSTQVTSGDTTEDADIIFEKIK
jgi:hypothetical protein